MSSESQSDQSDGSMIVVHGGPNRVRSMDHGMVSISQDNGTEDTVAGDHWNHKHATQQSVVSPLLPPASPISMQSATHNIPPFLTTQNDGDLVAPVNHATQPIHTVHATPMVAPPLPPPAKSKNFWQRAPGYRSSTPSTLSSTRRSIFASQHANFTSLSAPQNVPVHPSDVVADTSAKHDSPTTKLPVPADTHSASYRSELTHKMLISTVLDMATGATKSVVSDTPPTTATVDFVEEDSSEEQDTHDQHEIQPPVPSVTQSESMANLQTMATPHDTCHAKDTAAHSEHPGLHTVLAGVSGPPNGIHATRPDPMTTSTLSMDTRPHGVSENITSVQKESPKKLTTTPAHDPPSSYTPIHHAAQEIPLPTGSDVRVHVANPPHVTHTNTATVHVPTVQDVPNVIQNPTRITGASTPSPQTDIPPLHTIQIHATDTPGMHASAVPSSSTIVSQVEPPMLPALASNSITPSIIHPFAATRTTSPQRPSLSSSSSSSTDTSEHALQSTVRHRLSVRSESQSLASSSSSDHRRPTRVTRSTQPSPIQSCHNIKHGSDHSASSIVSSQSSAALSSDSDIRQYDAADDDEDGLTLSRDSIRSDSVVSSKRSHKARSAAQPIVATLKHSPRNIETLHESPIVPHGYHNDTHSVRSHKTAPRIVHDSSLHSQQHAVSESLTMSESSGASHPVDKTIALLAQEYVRLYSAPVTHPLSSHPRNDTVVKEDTVLPHSLPLQTHVPSSVQTMQHNASNTVLVRPVIRRPQDILELEAKRTYYGLVHRICKSSYGRHLVWDDTSSSHAMPRPTSERSDDVELREAALSMAQLYRHRLLDKSRIASASSSHSEWRPFDPLTSAEPEQYFPLIISSAVLTTALQSWYDIIKLKHTMDAQDRKVFYPHDDDAAKSIQPHGTTSDDPWMDLCARQAFVWCRVVDLAHLEFMTLFDKAKERHERLQAFVKAATYLQQHADTLKCNPQLAHQLVTQHLQERRWLLAHSPQFEKIFYGHERRPKKPSRDPSDTPAAPLNPSATIKMALMVLKSQFKTHLTTQSSS